MILRRLGNKSKIAQDIQKYFPPHRIYIELFFGAGGMFFNKPLAEHNFLNDLDDEVYNLFNVVKMSRSELTEAVEQMPIHETLFNYWKDNNEENPIWRAARFLMLSNMSYMGKSDTLHHRTNNSPKPNIINRIDKTFEKIKDARFLCTDFRKVFKKIVFECGKDRDRDISNVLIYADPPYLDQTHNYSHSFTESDSLDLFNCLEETGCKYAMSEFDHPFILQQAKERKLNVVTIGERQNLKNRRTEILVMNYNQVPTLF